MKIYDYDGKKNICGDRLREARVVRRLRQEDLAARIQIKGINNYPREILGFETSGSLFERYVAEAA